MPSRMDRGEYRSFYVAMADDPDIHALSGNAFKLLFMLKMTLGPAGIGVVYPSKLCDQVGCDGKQELERLLVELETPKPGNDHGWIERERNVVWIINGLAFEPNFSPLNVKKHVPYIRGLVAQLSPNLAIVGHFKARYPEWFANEQPTTEEPKKEPSKGNRKGTDTLSNDTPEKGANGTQPDRVSDHKTIQDKKKQSKTSGDLRREGAPQRGRDSAAPLAGAIADLPEDATRFLSHFYPKGVVAKERREEVARQIIGTLNGGTLLRAGEVVYAYGADRLAKKCREVINEGVKNRDRAIVVLLIKLNDTSDVTEGKSREEADIRAAQDRQRDRELAAAEAWLAEYPLTKATIDAALERLGFPVDEELDGAEAIGRAFTRTSLLLDAWRQAGSPEPAHV